MIRITNGDRTTELAWDGAPVSVSRLLERAGLHPDRPCGGQGRCASCTCPDAPCRFPEEQVVSMEAYGLLVSQVCQDCGAAYYHGPRTMTYVSCVFLRRGL